MELIIKSKKYGNKVVLYDKDDEDLILSQNSWILHKRAEGKFYVYCQNNNGKHRTKVYMHRLIMGFPIGWDIDHKDGDGLNNCKTNLRITSRSNNIANQVRVNVNETGFKGVHIETRRGVRTGKYFALLMVNRKRIVRFGISSPIEAARTYNQLALKHYGEFAKLNTIPIYE